MPKYPLSDIGNAQMLADTIRPTCLHVPGGRDGMWYHYDGTRWAVDAQASHPTRAMMELAITQLQTAADESTQKHWRRTQYENRIRAAVTLARVYCPAESAQFDASPDHLNCRNCVVDLRDGATSAHDPAYYFTRVVPIRYIPNAACPTWERFLSEAIPDAGTRHYLQTAIGYSLTGHNTEQVYFYLWGPPSTGKSTITDTIYDLIGPYDSGGYANALDSASLTTRKQGVRSDLAMLAGSRVVISSELRPGDTLDTGLVKRMTGDGNIQVAKKYENEINVRPSWKLWVPTNSQPIIPAGDEAIWRRVRVFKLGVFIDPTKIDRGLREKIRAEAEGVLRWMIDGARRWYAEGLHTPVRMAKTQAYVKANRNSIGDFLLKRCEIKPGLMIGALELYTAYREFCKTVALDDKPASIQVFKEQVGLWRGVEHKPTNKRNVYVGIGLRNVSGPSFNPLDAGEAIEDDESFLDRPMYVEETGEWV